MTLWFFSSRAVRVVDGEKDLTLALSGFDVKLPAMEKAVLQGLWPVLWGGCIFLQVLGGGGSLDSPPPPSATRTQLPLPAPSAPDARNPSSPSQPNQQHRHALGNLLGMQVPRPPPQTRWIARTRGGAPSSLDVTSPPVGSEAHSTWDWLVYLPRP